MVEFKKGSIFDSPFPILHQCNCVTRESAFLAKEIFEKYPFSNTYRDREKPSFPGTVSVLQGKKSKKIIINLYGQYYPGKSKYPSDSKEKRLFWFRKGLEMLKDYEFEALSVPFRIGCGSAGGNWDDYYGLLKEFSESGTRVVIYKL